MIDTRGRGRPSMERPRTHTVATKTDEATVEGLRAEAAELGVRPSSLLHELLTSELERRGRLPQRDQDATDDDGQFTPTL